jgi:hypothetical protein
MDFDGSVISTGRFAEGTAVGYNTHKKGERSYYPWFCTIAQTAQVLDVLHRSGNVHDSPDSLLFMAKCIAVVRARLPQAVLESRKDSAFFNDLCRAGEPRGSQRRASAQCALRPRVLG